MPPRFCTIGIPRFMHDGLVVTESWAPIDIAKLEEKARKALLDYYGRLIQVHPADHSELAKLGLEVVAGADGRQVLRAKKVTRT